MRVIDLALKDLSQIVRDWKSALFMMAMPIVFTMFFGFVFSFGNEDPRLPVGFVDRDPAGALGSHLLDLLEMSEPIRPVVLDERDAGRAGELVRDEELTAVVIVPAGASERALSGEEPQLTVIVDPNAQVGHAVSNAIHATVVRLLSALQTAHLSAQAFETDGGFENQAARRAYLDAALANATDAWRQPPLAIVVEGAGGATEGAEQEPANSFTQSSPGMIVMFVVFGLMTTATVLVLERKSRALQRLLTTPITRAEVIGGHLLAMFLVVLLQETLLISVGQLAFGVDYMHDPLGTILVMVTLALWAASLGMLIGAISTSEDQATTWSLIAMFVFAAMGGAWFPLEFAGPVFSSIGHLTPTAWAMDGFQNIVLRGLGLSSVLLPAGILLAYAVAFFGLAVWRFRFE